MNFAKSLVVESQRGPETLMSESHNGKSRILVVEDNPDDVVLIEEFFRQAERHVSLEMAPSIHAALARLQNGPYDLFLLDYRLKGESGLALLETLRSRNIDTPVIVMTAHGDEELAVEAMRLGATDYIVKSNLARDLIPACDRSIEEHHAEQKRKKIRDEVERSEERFKASVGNTSDATAFLDESARILYLSRSLLGYSIRELVGRNAFSTIHPEDKERAQELLMQSLKQPGIPARFEHRFRHKDGSWRHLEGIGVNQLNDPALGALVVSYRDVTDQTEAQIALAETNERLRALIEASPTAIIETDINDCITTWNAAAERIFGWSRDEVLGKILPFIPEEKQDGYLAMEKRFAQGNVLTGVEVQLRRRDDAIADISFSVAPLRDNRGNIRGRVSILSDITDQKRLAEQLNHAQKLEAVGRLSGGIAHDFNNLLTAISGYSDMLLDLAGKNNGMTDLLYEIKKAGERAALLTRRLLAFSRKQAVRPKILDLNSLVMDVERLLRRIIGEDIDLTTVLSPEISHIRADQSQIEQVLMNLAVNARDAMPRGGKLTISTEPAQLDDQRFSHLEAGAYVLLTVSDNGTGMDEQTKARIFEPFFTTKKDRGTGLGLSIVHGIVKQSGGRIVVTSEPGKGAEFRIYFRPEAGSPEAPEAESQIFGEDLRGSEVLLLVEDDAIVRNFTARLLDGNGYTVLQAPNAEEALRICNTHAEKIGLVITDLVMPEMSGHDLANQLQVQKPDLKVLYISGYTDNISGPQGALDPRTNFLAKPFTPLALLQRIKRLTM